MSGLRILNVYPRLIGSIAGWSGFSSPDGRSQLIDYALHMGFNAIWFNPLNKTTDAIVERHGRKLTGSVYAITNHFTLDPEFSAAPQEEEDNIRAAEDDRHLRHFNAEAEKNGVTVMADMVFNHVAKDHPQVTAENKKIAVITQDATNIAPIYKELPAKKDHEGHDISQRALIGFRYDQNGQKDREFYFKFSRNEDFSLLFNSTDTETWDDVAQVNYDSPAGMGYFVTGTNGKPGYWKRVLDWHLDRGFTGFRCDVAYKVPSAAWSELIQHAHNRLPNVVFMGETLGDNGMANALKNAVVTVDGKKEKAFDLAMLPLYWWNFRDRWIIKENKRLQKISRYGGAGFADNHDTPTTLATYAMKIDSQYSHEQTAAHICVRNYAIAALVSSSVYMQMGFELGRRQISVFADIATPQYWSDLVRERGDETHPLNLVKRIKIINAFKAELDAANAIVRFDNFSGVASDERLRKIECTLIDRDNGVEKGKMSIFLNDGPERGPIRTSEKELGQEQGNEKMRRLILGTLDKPNATDFDVYDCAIYYTPSIVAPVQTPDFTAASSAAPAPAATPDFATAAQKTPSPQPAPSSPAASPSREYIYRRPPLFQPGPVPAF